MLASFVFKLTRFIRIAALLPSMSRAEIRFLESFLTKTTIVLEWGAGGSTIHFSRFVQKYYSIEHSKKWADRITKASPPNVALLLIPGTGNYPDYAAFNTLGDGDIADFWDYAHGFERLSETPTVYLLDGRVRLDCLRLISPRLRSDTKVFLHDFQRYASQISLEKLRVVEVVGSLALLQTSAQS